MSGLGKRLDGVSIDLFLFDDSRSRANIADVVRLVVDVAPVAFAFRAGDYTVRAVFPSHRVPRPGRIENLALTVTGRALIH